VGEIREGRKEEEEKGKGRNLIVAQLIFCQSLKKREK